MGLKLRIFGCGPSSGVPNLKCRMYGGCEVCSSVKRTNVSLLVSKIDDNTKKQIGSVLFDCTKHFYEQFKQYLDDLHVGNNSNCVIDKLNEESRNNSEMPEKIKKISSGSLRTPPTAEMSEIDQMAGMEIPQDFRKDLIPTLILTHPHADAIGGIDTYLVMNDEPVPLFCDQITLDYLMNSFKYYFKKPTRDKIRGYFSEDKIETLKDNGLFMAGQLNIQSFSMIHGHVIAMGFLIEEKVLYISDCSIITEDQLEKFKKYDLEYLLIDCLALKGQNEGHLNLDDVKEYVEIIKPKNVILVGCSHKIPNVKYIDNFLVAYDGMELEIQ